MVTLSLWTSLNLNQGDFGNGDFVPMNLFDGLDFFLFWVYTILINHMSEVLNARAKEKNISACWSAYRLVVDVARPHQGRL